MAPYCADYTTTQWIQKLVDIFIIAINQSDLNQIHREGAGRERSTACTGR